MKLLTKTISKHLFIFILSTFFTVNSLCFANDLTDSEKIYNWAERDYSQYFFPAGGESFEIIGYWARYYSKTNTYIGSKEGQVFIYGDIFNGLQSVGPISQWLPLASENQSTAFFLKDSIAFKPNEIAIIKVPGVTLIQDSYQALIDNETTITLNKINDDELLLIFPELPKGSHSLEFVIQNGQTFNLDFQLNEGVIIDKPNEYISEYVEQLTLELNGISDAGQSIAIINSIAELEKFKTQLTSLSENDLKTLAVLIDTNIPNTSNLTSSLNAKKIDVANCAKLLVDLVRKRISISKKVAFVALIGAAVLTGGIPGIAIAAISIVALIKTANSYTDTQDNILNECVYNEHELELNYFASKTKVFTKSNSTSNNLEFVESETQNFNIISKNRYDDSVTEEANKVVGLINKITKYNPSSFNGLQQAMDSWLSKLVVPQPWEEVESANGFYISSISNPNITGNISSNGDNLSISFKWNGDKDVSPQSFSYAVTKDATSSEDTINIVKNATLIVSECTDGSTDTLDCNIENGLGFETRSCSADGSWGGYSSCELSHCNTGFMQSGNSCVPEVKPMVGRYESCPYDVYSTSPSVSSSKAEGRCFHDHPFYARVWLENNKIKFYLINAAYARGDSPVEIIGNNTLKKTSDWKEYEVRQYFEGRYFLEKYKVRHISTITFNNDRTQHEAELITEYLCIVNCDYWVSDSGFGRGSILVEVTTKYHNP